MRGTPARTRAGSIALASLVALSLSACNDETGGSEKRTIPENCGLPTAPPDMIESRVPDEFLLGGDGKVSGVQKVAGGMVTTINLPYGVQEALPLYREAIRTAGFDLKSEDNEGFEAELYFEGNGFLAALQIRTSTCRNASLAFVNMIREAALEKGLTPAPLITSSQSPTPVD